MVNLAIHVIVLLVTLVITVKGVITVINKIVTCMEVVRILEIPTYVSVNLDTLEEIANTTFALIIHVSMGLHVLKDHQITLAHAPEITLELFVKHVIIAMGKIAPDVECVIMAKLVIPVIVSRHTEEQTVS